MSAATMTRPTTDKLTLTAADVTALRRVLPAAGKDSDRAPLTGVLIGKGWAVATDSYRLHAAKVSVRGSAVLVDAKALGKALGSRKAAPMTVDTVAVVDVRGRTVDPKQFPNWQPLVPAEGSETATLTVGKVDLTDALRRAAVCEGGPTVLRIDDESRLWVAAEGGDMPSSPFQRGDSGRAVTFREWMPATVSGTFPTWYAANTRYLTDLVATAGDGATVTITFRDELKPCMVRDGGFLALLMPTRIDKCDVPMHIDAPDWQNAPAIPWTPPKAKPKAIKLPSRVKLPKSGDTVPADYWRPTFEELEERDRAKGIAPNAAEVPKPAPKPAAQPEPPKVEPAPVVPPVAPTPKVEATPQPARPRTPHRSTRPTIKPAPAPTPPKVRKGWPKADNRAWAAKIRAAGVNPCGEPWQAAKAAYAAGNDPVEAAVATAAKIAAAVA